jgi:hypothetical protein
MNVSLERRYPLIGSGIVTIGYLLIHRKLGFVSREALTNLFTAMVGVSAIAVGFLATAQSILFSLENRRVTQFLKDAGAFNSLIDYMMQAIHLSFILAALSAFALLVDPKAQRWWYPYAFAAWLFTLCFAGMAYYRVVSIFARILRSSD